MFFPVSDDTILAHVRERVATAPWNAGAFALPADVSLRIVRKGGLHRVSDGATVVYCAMVESDDPRVHRSRAVWCTLYYDQGGEPLRLA